MFKIGILGSDNSHALIYSSLINKPDPATGLMRFPGFQVTHIFGLDPQLTRERAEGAAIPNIVEKPEDMLGQVDAVIAVFRHGDLHCPYVLPFLEAGVHAFVDKPFSIRPLEAQAMIRSAAKSGAILTGGSSNKYLKDLQRIKKELEAEQSNGLDRFVTAFISFEINLAPQYGGIHFYGPHTVESALYLFGCDVKSVYASRTDKNILAILKYERKQVTLNFMYSGKGFSVTLVNDEGACHHEINAEDDYISAMENFIAVLQNGKSDLDSQQILMSVAVLSAIERSLAENREYAIGEVLRECP